MRLPILLVFVVSSLLVAPAALAEASLTDRNLAQSLFEEAKQLMEQGQYAEACAKFAESQRLDPGGGTLLNLALCREKEGKLASAWSDYKEALSVARRDGRADRAQAAEEHIGALEPLLPWLTLQVSEPVQGLQIRLDGAQVGEAAWGTPVSIDPGTHLIVASAPGRRDWTVSLTMAAGEKKAVEVPVLDEAVAAEPAVAPAAPSAAPASTPGEPVPPAEPAVLAVESGESDVTAWVLIGAGIGALGVGSYFGVTAFQKHSQSSDECPDDTSCSRRGVELEHQANTAAWIANLGVGLGLVGVGAGAYLLLSDGGADTTPTGEARSRRSVALGGTVLPGGGGVLLEGMW